MKYLAGIVLIIFSGIEYTIAVYGTKIKASLSFPKKLLFAVITILLAILGFYLLSNNRGSKPNGASLRFRCTPSVPVRDRFHFRSRRSQQLITFGSSLDATRFTSPWSLPDRSVGHRII